MSKNVFDIKGELLSNAYPGRGIIFGRTLDNKQNVVAYFIMGRSENSRNRIFVETEDGIRTQAFDPSKMTDPSLIIYHPVRQCGGKLVVTKVPPRLRMSTPASTVASRIVHPSAAQALASRAPSMWSFMPWP